MIMVIVDVIRIRYNIRRLVYRIIIIFIVNMFLDFLEVVLEVFELFGEVVDIIGVVGFVVVGMFDDIVVVVVVDVGVIVVVVDSVYWMLDKFIVWEYVFVVVKLE